jgi:predicted PurR-regulated permease PerM
VTKQLIIFGTAIMTTLLALVLLWQFRMVVAYVLISLTLAAALRPMARRLKGQAFVLRLAWILLYLVALASLAALLLLTIDAAVHESQQLARGLSVQDAWKLPLWLEGSAFEQALITRLTPPSQLLAAVIGDQGQLVLPAVLGFTQGLGSVVSAGLIILVLSIYWSINQIHFERLWLSLLPSAERNRARGVWRTAEPDIGAYVRGEAIQCLLVGLLFGLGFWVLGSPYPALLALIGALASLIPMVGVALAVLPVLILGLLTSVQLAMVTTIYALVVMIGLGLWIKPRLFNRRWDNPILTLVLLIALADAFGLVGIILAPPLSAVCQILWSRLVSHRAVSGAASLMSDLRERQVHLRDTVREMGDPALPLVTSSMDRLARLMEQAEPLLGEDLPANPSP